MRHRLTLTITTLALSLLLVLLSACGSIPKPESGTTAETGDKPGTEALEPGETDEETADPTHADDGKLAIPGFEGAGYTLTTDDNGVLTFTLTAPAADQDGQAIDKVTRKYGEGAHLLLVARQLNSKGVWFVGEWLEVIRERDEQTTLSVGAVGITIYVSSLDQSGTPESYIQLSPSHSKNFSYTEMNKEAALAMGQVDFLTISDQAEELKSYMETELPNGPTLILYDSENPNAVVPQIVSEIPDFRLTQAESFGFHVD
ncbi:MAG: hypothetical protein J6023_07810 [Clostridia bacterium]|nr:hypothetical protein [Clostridia bacterium]